jgi:acyl-CoA dehydrogenase
MALPNIAPDSPAVELTAAVAGPLERATWIARNVAAPAAASVDRDARFPTESFVALREAGLLSALVPRRFGGLGCSITEISAICDVLGQYCANTAMIYAMHQIQVASIVRHGQQAPYFRELLHELVPRQLLLASATTEVIVGGDVRSSVCAVELEGDALRLRKQAPVISYGEQADAILVTARRTPESAASDQVLVIARKDVGHDGETTLERTGGWDALGFRGTCSCGYVLETRGSAAQILPDAYDDISSRTMLPFSHILWSSLWLGIATDAVNRARAFIRDAARKKPGTTPPGAIRLAEAMGELQTMRAGVQAAIREYEEIYDDADALSSIGFALRMNNLKVQSSTLVVRIVQQALAICGIAGYKADTKYSVERHLRDAYGAGIMISNERVLGASASMLLVYRDE